MSIENQVLLYFFLFLFLNQINTYFLTKEKLNRYIAPCQTTLRGELTSLLGNVAMLFVLLILGHILFQDYQGLFIYLIIVSFILNVLCLALSVYNQFFGTAFSKEGLEMFKNPASPILKGVPLELIKELIFYYRIVLLLPSVVLLIFYITFDKNTLTTFLLDANQHLYWVMMAGLMLILYLHKRIFNQLFSKGPAIEAIKSTYAIQNLGVYPYYLSPLSFVRYRRRMKKILGYKQLNELIPQLEALNKNKTNYRNIIDQKTYGNRLYKEQVSSTIHVAKDFGDITSLQGLLKGKKLVMIQVESLNHWLLTLPQLASERPFLNALLQECVVCTNFYTSVGIGVSSDAEIATQTGLFPSGKNIMFWHSFNQKKQQYDQELTFTALAKYFKQAGYFTKALHGDEGVFYNRSYAYPYLLGFDEFFALENFKEKMIARRTPTMTLYASDYLTRKHISPWLSDYTLAKHSANLVQSNTLQYLFPITMMPHTPFEFNPEPNRLVFEGCEDLQAMTQRYLNFTYYYDRFIRRFFVNEEQQNITDTNTVYLFYGDHGSGLKNGDLAKLFQQPLTNEEERKHLLHVACFLYVPGTKLNQEGIYEGLIKGEQPLVRGQIDLYRTIIELFDLPCAKDFYMGVHLLSQEPTFVIDNRVVDIVYDQGLFSMRNPKKTAPKTLQVPMDLYQYVRHLKLLNDILYKEPSLQQHLNHYLQHQE